MNLLKLLSYTFLIAIALWLFAMVVGNLILWILKALGHPV
jgi:hypothetical protein